MPFHNDSPFGDSSALYPAPQKESGPMQQRAVIYVPGPDGHAREVSQGVKPAFRLDPGKATVGGDSFPYTFGWLNPDASWQQEEGVLERLRTLVYSEDCPDDLKTLRTGQGSRESEKQCLELFVNWVEVDGLRTRVAEDVEVSTAYGGKVSPRRIREVLGV